MSTFNNYPIFTNGNCPYLDGLKIKLNHAKEFHPSKVGYYEQLIKEWVEHTPKTETEATNA